MVRTIILIVMAGAAMFVAPYAASQPCDYPIDITISDVSAKPCTLNQISIPVYMTNPCDIGGFTVAVRVTDSTWLGFRPNDTTVADRNESRIVDWDHFTYYVNPLTPWKITVTALAGAAPPLPPGQGLIFTLHITYKNYLIDDSSQTLGFGTVQVSDPTGYFLDSTSLTPGSFYVEPSACRGNPRGDANCSGVRSGIDVTYLVNYFKGGTSFCLLCSGDANHSGRVDGLDVTFLINYFKGFGPAPDPCDSR